MRRITESEPTAIQELNPDIPEWFCSLVGQLMAKEKADRFQSAQEVHELLEACLSHIQQPNAIPLPEIPNVARARVPDQRQPFLKRNVTRTALLIAVCLLFASLLTPFTKMMTSPVHIETVDESPFMAQFRAAEKITDQNQSDQAFATLAKNAATSGDVVMTKRALDHIVKKELESPTRRDCAIAMFRIGKHDEAHSLAEAIYHQKDRDAALLAFVGGQELQAAAASADQERHASNGGDEQQDNIPTDPDAILGTWRVIFAEDSGRTGPPEALRDIRFVITKDKVTMESGGRREESTYTLDPSTSPKSIDLTTNGRTKPGIYDLQGDTLRICISENSDKRPTAFDSQPDSVNDVVLTMKRMTPEALDEKTGAKQQK